MAGQSDNGIAYQPYVRVESPAPRRRTRRHRRRVLRHRVFEAVMVCSAVAALGGAALTSILKMIYPGM